MALSYFSPEQTSQFGSFGVNDIPGGFQQGWQSYYYNPSNLSQSGKEGMGSGPGVDFTNEFNSLGLDPNGTYGSNFVGSGDNRSRVLYQQLGDQWNPVSSRLSPEKDTYRNMGLKALQLGAIMYGGIGALNGLGALGATSAAEGAGAIGANAAADYSLASATGFAPAVAGEGITPLAAGSAMGSGIGYIPSTVGTATLGGSLYGAPAGTEQGFYAPQGFEYGQGLGSSLGEGSSLGSALGEGSSLSSLYETPQAFNYSLGGDFGGGLSVPGVSGPSSSVNIAPSEASASSSIWDDFSKLYKKASPFIQAGRTISGLVQANKGAKAAGQQAKMITQAQQQLGDLFGPNSPYAQALRQQLERKDAAAGRRSQYGPREVELQARLAEAQAKTLPQIADMSKGALTANDLQQKNRNQQIFAALQGAPAFVSSLKDIYNMFG